MFCVYLLAKDRVCISVFLHFIVFVSIYTKHEVFVYRVPNSIVCCAELSFIQEWRPSINAREKANALFPRGNIFHTHPQSLRKVYSKFPPLTPDRLNNVDLNWLSPEADAHVPFELMRPPRCSGLNDFERPSPEQSGSQFEQISYAVAVRRIKEVHYDRGAIVDAIDIEAKEMADCRKRYKSFNTSEHLQGKVGAYQLSQLGFFFVGDRNSPGKLRCSFCCITIQLFTTEEIFLWEKDWDRRLLALLQQHAHLSATCPSTLGLNGDDKRFLPVDIARLIDLLIRRQVIQHEYVNLNISPQIDSSHLRITCASIISQCPNGLPPLDGDMSNTYNNVIAELEYELHTPFETESDFENELSAIDDLTPHTTPIDYFVGVEPKYSYYLRLQSRIDSFIVVAWHQHPISRTDSPLLKPDYFAKAGFYYSGTDDNVICFWCRLGLNYWKVNDDPITQHVQFAPRCIWLLRLLGRQRVKYLYMKANGTQVGGIATAQNIKLTDYTFIRDVEDIAGTWALREILQ